MNNQPIAIVTGAGGGIGRAIALSLAGAGWSVLVNDINRNAASQTAESIVQQGGNAIGVQADVGIESEVTELFAALKQHFTHNASLLVNNAAVQTWATLKTLSVEDWQHTLNTNLTGCFLMTRAFATTAPPESLIVNLGSGCNKQAFPNLVDYTASKGGIEMFTKSAALELGPQGIRVNCIAPGAIATERTAAETDDYNRSWAQLTPLQRIGTPQDVANAVLLLADEKAAFITGQTLHVDGGLFSRAVWPVDY